jgi:hypothetical protein
MGATLFLLQFSDPEPPPAKGALRPLGRQNRCHPNIWAPGG